MRHELRGLAMALSLLAGVAGAAPAQIPYRSGQTIQPVYEGWERNPDGTFTMWFGYLNRNYDETPHVPVGESNAFSPGPADRGQPTFFYPRRQSFVFPVTVPADWGEKDLVWSVHHNGKAYTAVGSLWESWALDEGVWRANRGSGIGGRTRMELTNNPPTIRIAGPTTRNARVGEPVRIPAVADDDGKPGPRRGYVFGGEGVGRKVAPLPNFVPTFGGNHSGAASGTGGPTDQSRVNVAASFQTGLAVTWILYRGPGRVTLEGAASAPVEPGQESVVTATFSEPGTYVVRAIADDSSFLRSTEVTVVVTGAGATGTDR